jgi:hypothetical protein
MPFGITSSCDCEGSFSVTLFYVSISGEVNIWSIYHLKPIKKVHKVNKRTLTLICHPNLFIVAVVTH